VMKEGRIVQVEAGEELYRRPRTRFVAEFLGRANCIDGLFQRDSGDSRIVTPGGANLAVDPARKEAHGRSCTAVVRAEDIEPHAQRPHDDAMTGVAGQVALRLFEGEAVYYEVAVAGIERPLRVACKTGAFAPGDDVWLAWRRDRVWVVGE
jgi:ABC-type Fe3+/spermidine/putrescine transport system ATPase subunit